MRESKWMRAGGITVLCALAGLLVFGAAAPERDGKRYKFLPARENLWVVDREKGSVLFFKFPSTEERPIQRSKALEIDRKRFPRGRTRYLVSERAFSSVLWVVNDSTGDIRCVRYAGKGKFGPEFFLPVARQFQ